MFLSGLIQEESFFCGGGYSYCYCIPQGGYLKHSEDLCVNWHAKNTSSSKRTVFRVVKKCRQLEMSKATLVSLTTICQLRENS